MLFSLDAYISHIQLLSLSPGANKNSENKTMKCKTGELSIVRTRKMKSKFHENMEVREEQFIKIYHCSYLHLTGTLQNVRQSAENKRNGNIKQELHLHVMDAYGKSLVCLEALWRHNSMKSS